MELITLNKFLRQINRDFYDTQKRLTAEEFSEFFRDRIRYRVSIVID
jgi:hypothetical protein